MSKHYRIMRRQLCVQHADMDGVGPAEESTGFIEVQYPGGWLQEGAYTALRPTRVPGLRTVLITAPTHVLDDLLGNVPGGQLAVNRLLGGDQ